MEERQITRLLIVLVVLVILLSACSSAWGAGSPGMVIESPERRALIATAQAIGNTAEARRVHLEKTRGGVP